MASSNREKKIGLIIGRFQPLTFAHLNQLLLPALSNCDQVILLLGSSNDNDNINNNNTVSQNKKKEWHKRNPFPFVVREQMVRDTIASIENPDYNDKLIILPMPDATISGIPPSPIRVQRLISTYGITPNSIQNYKPENIWYYYLGKILEKYISKGNIKIILYGSNKDPATKAYLYKIVKLSLKELPFNTSFSDPQQNTDSTVNATKVRTALFKTRRNISDMEYLTTYVPPPVLNIVIPMVNSMMNNTPRKKNKKTKKNEDI